MMKKLLVKRVSRMPIPRLQRIFNLVACRFVQ